MCPRGGSSFAMKVRAEPYGPYYKYCTYMSRSDKMAVTFTPHILGVTAVILSLFFFQTLHCLAKEHSTMI